MDKSGEIILVLIKAIGDIKVQAVESQSKLIVEAQLTRKIYEDILKELKNQTMILKHRGKLEVKK